MYVSDSLFFIQHLFTDKDADEDHGAMFGLKLRDLIEEYEQNKEAKPKESADEIMNRMIAKSEKMCGKRS